jgi:hypothetical protein
MDMHWRQFRSLIRCPPRKEYQQEHDSTPVPTPNWAVGFGVVLQREEKNMEAKRADDVGRPWPLLTAWDLRATVANFVLPEFRRAGWYRSTGT